MRPYVGPRVSEEVLGLGAAIANVAEAFSLSGLRARLRRENTPRLESLGYGSLDISAASGSLVDWFYGSIATMTDRSPPILGPRV